MMRSFKDVLRITFMFSLASVALPYLGLANNGSEDIVKRLRYPNAYKLQTQEGKEDDTFTISFETKLPYPSRAVLGFYERELIRLGWSSVKEPRKWDCFEDLTIDGHPVVYQLGAKWANRERTRVVLVVLRYYSSGVTDKEKGAGCPGPKNDVQHVYVQIRPFSLAPPSGPAAPPK